MAAPVTFKKIVPGGIPPQRATRDALGTLPANALRYCEPVTSASGFGWYVFPPLEFKILFDGVGSLWTYGEMDEWYPLQPAAQYPGFSNQFDKMAPPDVRGFSPPFLLMAEHPGLLQIWTGLIARTPPDCSLLLRAPANLPMDPGYFPLEGIIETDRWGGPLFTNVRLTHTGVPIHFQTHRPLLQIQPVHRAHYADRFLDMLALEEGLDKMSSDDWAAYHRTVVVPSFNPKRSLGAYAVSARKRRAEEK